MGYRGRIDYGFCQVTIFKTPRQVGLLFKPITYLAALEAGPGPCNYYEIRLLTYAKY